MHMLTVTCFFICLFPRGKSGACSWEWESGCLRSGAGLLSAAASSRTWDEPSIVEAALPHPAMEIIPAAGCGLWRATVLCKQ